MRRALARVLVVLLFSLSPSSAMADDAGDAAACTECSGSCIDPSTDPDNCGSCGTTCQSGTCQNGSCVPLACDGALCDTSAESTCDVGQTPGHGGSSSTLVVAGALLGLALLLRRRLAWVGGSLLMMTHIARAEPPAQTRTGDGSGAGGLSRTPVDVVIDDAPPARRYVSLAWNPVPIFALGKVSFDVVIAPVDHHALVLSPYYVTTTTVPFFVYNDITGSPTALPQQTFEGFGGEIGYRYYFGLGGPRGFFVGGSFLIGAFTATAQNSTQTHYMSFGGAVDVGYQALVADRVVLGAGLGLQYTAMDTSLPNQQFPANLYANSGLYPRLLLSVGWAF
jgi:hypothetical protein